MLYVVVAVHGNLGHVAQLFDGLCKASATVPLRIVAVDNDSDQATREYLGSFGPSVQVLYNVANMGAACAWNQGIRFSIEQSAAKILVVGSDTAPAVGTVERLDALIDQGIPFVTGTQVPYDRPVDDVPLAEGGDSLVAAPDFSFFMFRPDIVVQAVGRWDAAAEYARVQQVPNSPALMDAWSYGLFDQKYGSYFEDNDYHFRMKKAGVPALRDPKALFRHDCSLTIRTSGAAAELNAIQFPRNAELFRAKWGKLPHEFADIQQARPLNVSDEQWIQMTGGHPIEELNVEEYVGQCREVYRRYGIQA